ncbi:MAG: hypothetical protein K0R00_923 [Herbinix sp.]|jgi:hypothetical protein|nr:hypothetical protein [Herbinix sp.]
MNCLKNKKNNDGMRCYEKDCNTFGRCEHSVASFAEVKKERKNIIRGIFCLNSECRHYFEDNCMHILEKDTISISRNGKCETFEIGINIGYEQEKHPRFRLDEDSICYGCRYFISEEEIGVPVPEEDLQCGGICDCNIPCNGGIMNEYRQERKKHGRGKQQ